MRTSRSAADGPFLGVPALRPTQLEHLTHLLAHADRRVQSAARVLVDHRDDVAVVAAQRLAAEPEHVAPGDVQGARGDPAVSGQVADDRVGDGRLAAARLADEPVASLLTDRERDPADDLPVAPADAIHDLEVAKLQCGGGFVRHSSTTCWTVSAMRLMATTREAMARAGKMVAHHARLMSEYCSAICRPQSGEGGCGP